MVFRYQFNLGGFLLFCASIPPIIWIVTVFDIDYRLIDLSVVDGKLLSSVPTGATVRALLLGLAMGVAALTALIGWLKMVR